MRLIALLVLGAVASGLLPSPPRSAPLTARQLSVVAHAASQSGAASGAAAGATVVKNIRHYTRTPGKLILIRHGESLMNERDTFSGWIDSDLSENGRKEMEHASRLMLERGYSNIDVVYTSRLRRAIRSAWVLLKELNSIFRPLENSWRLNQRHFGAFEGVHKSRLVQEMGEARVDEYRHSLFIRPPPMSPSHPHWHGSEDKYKELASEDKLPSSESAYDCWQRVVPFYEENIVPDLLAGKTVVVVGHANSLRGLIRRIDGLPDAEVQSLSLPSGIPVVYSFDQSLQPVQHPSRFAPLSACFLESPKALRLLLEKEKAWGNPEAQQYKGLYSLINYDDTSLMVPPATVPLMQGLSTLERERQALEQLGAESGDAAAVTQDGDEEQRKEHAAPPLASSLDPADFTSSIGDRYIVFIRHGQTDYNKLGIFTGWDDAPLSAEGLTQAHEAGKLLRLHGIRFDVVYTSWLSRAIETAWAVVDELDLLWLPIIKSWRLNERMYGALTGQSKRGIAERFGETQLKAWRRGYAVRPPPVHSFSLAYPGNDERYYKYVTDLRVSVSETIMRSISKGKLEIHRKFPKTESLKDCMTRTIPLFTDEIVPNAVAKGKHVLVASSENAIRGLLMHLCDIPAERIHEIDIPNSLPLVYNLDRKCIQILDDGQETEADWANPLRRYHFGESPELLFKPCDYAGVGDATECFIGDDGRSFAYDPIIRLRRKEDE